MAQTFTNNPGYGGSKKRKGPEGSHPTDFTEHWKQLIENTARLSVANSSAIRQLKAISTQTFLLPSTSCFVTAAKHASEKWESDRKNHQMPQFPPYIAVFIGLVKCACEQSSFPEAAKRHCDELLCRYTADHLLNFVKICRLTRCFDHTFFKLEIACSGPLQEVCQQLCEFLVASGAKACFGSAPRPPLEREVSNAIFSQRPSGSMDRPADRVQSRPILDSRLDALWNSK